MYVNKQLLNNKINKQNTITKLNNKFNNQNKLPVLE